jgi:protein-disulfide isomerase-like protein with CxxC motif
MKEWQIKGFPTIMIKSNGNVIEFRGSRDMDTLSLFLDQFE